MGGGHFGAGEPSLYEEELVVLIPTGSNKIPRWPESVKIIVIIITAGVIPEL